MLLRAATIAGLGLLAFGCHAYQPGSFRYAGAELAGVHGTVGCVDVAVDRGADAAARGPVLAIAMANRCDHATRVDVSALRVVGRLGGGGAVRLAPFDPRDEIRPALLDARSVARETIEYRAPAADLEALCVELDGLAPGPAPQGGSMCLDYAAATMEARR